MKVKVATHDVVLRKQILQMKWTSALKLTS